MGKTIIKLAKKTLKHETLSSLLSEAMYDIVVDSRTSYNVFLYLSINVFVAKLQSVCLWSNLEL